MRQSVNRTIYYDYRDFFKIDNKLLLALKWFPTFTKWFKPSLKVNPNGMKVCNSFFTRGSKVNIGFLITDPLEEALFDLVKDKSYNGFRPVKFSTNRELQRKHRKFSFVSSDFTYSYKFLSSEFMYIQPIKPNDNIQRLQKGHRIDV